MDRAHRDVGALPLAQRFAESGVIVSDAVPAFAGMYPVLGGFGFTYGYLEPLLVRWRVLALAGGKAQVWTAWTGPTPKNLLRSVEVTDLEVRPGRRRYQRVRVGGYALWVHREHLPSIQSWRLEELS